MSFSIEEKPDGLIFNVRVQPRSSRNRVAGLFGDALKVNLTAPPVDNAANRACEAFFASLLPVAKSSVTIRSGQTGRNKQVMVHCQDGDLRNSIKRTILSWIKP
ncbi:MAG: DUF167 domain-containing protein [Desulfosarcina sp.]